MSFVQQPHSAEITPLGIPTFDHGVERRVYRYWPLDRTQRPIPVDLLWLFRKRHLDQWDVFCDCTPLPGTLGIPARIWTVKQPHSRFFGLTFIGCGRTNRHRCAFKACLNDIYKSVLALGPFPNPNYPPLPAPPPPPPPAIEPFQSEVDSSSPIPSSPLPSMASVQSPKPASPEPVDPQEIFDQIWAAFQEYDENPVQQELVQLFAGQHDVIVTPDGSIHYEPDLFAPKNVLLPGQGIGDEAVPSETDREKEKAEDDMYEPDADVTLVDIDHNDIKGAVGDALFQKEWVLHGHGTQAQPYDLTTDLKSMFIELCNACGNDIEDHNTAACVANLG
ncbi:hypothetical protein EV360DRAFT_75860 [Lentinula raphanica]|nr:hypothetical protein EV360DRAFT_75860 [Lentinula raphanica]